ncbi:MAG: nucleotide exchange factor GrpE [Actinobacteria bacterium]|nr:nucleotide exchange factor GrpE [Actinomycetota bacterium]
MSEQTTNDETTSAGDEQLVEQVGDEAAEIIDPLVAERDAALAQRDEYKDIALRLQADFENYRKRAAAQTADEIDRSTGKIAEALLPVLDACEAAFSHGVDGVEPIWSALIGALQKQGLEALDLQGRTGYRWKGRVLRAAMVKVRG